MFAATTPAPIRVAPATLRDRSAHARRSRLETFRTVAALVTVLETALVSAMERRRPAPTRARRPPAGRQVARTESLRLQHTATVPVHAHWVPPPHARHRPMRAQFAQRLVNAASLATLATRPAMAPVSPPPAAVSTRNAERAGPASAMSVPARRTLARRTRPVRTTFATVTSTKSASQMKNAESLLAIPAPPTLSIAATVERDSRAARTRRVTVRLAIVVMVPPVTTIAVPAMEHAAPVVAAPSVTPTSVPAAMERAASRAAHLVPATPTTARALLIPPTPMWGRAATEAPAVASPRIVASPGHALVPPRT